MDSHLNRGTKKMNNIKYSYLIIDKTNFLYYLYYFRYIG